MFMSNRNMVKKPPILFMILNGKYSLKKKINWGKKWGGVIAY